MGPWGNKQRSNKHFMIFAKTPGFPHDMFLKDVQVSHSSPRETLTSEAAAKTSGNGFFSYDELFLEQEYHNLI